MSVRAEVRRELERASDGIARVLSHLGKAGTLCVEGKRPEVDEALKGLGQVLVMVQENLSSLRDSI